jgi:hypothetical protein
LAELYGPIIAEVMNHVAGPGAWVLGSERKYIARGKRIHAKAVSPATARNGRCPFNINPNALDADYELWICGTADCYYLIPTDIVRLMYIDPDAYVNKEPGQEEIHTVTVLLREHSANYAKGGKRRDFKPYFLRTIPTG